WSPGVHSEDADVVAYADLKYTTDKYTYEGGYLGDVDGDGADDWFIYGVYTSNYGDLHVLSGAALTADATFPSDASALWVHGSAGVGDTFFGAVGDYDGDGVPDIGAYSFDYKYRIVSGAE